MIIILNLFCDWSRMYVFTYLGICTLYWTKFNLRFCCMISLMVLVVCSSFMSFVPNFANNWKDSGFTYLWSTTKVLSSKSMNVEISSLWYVTKILYDQPNELLPIFLPNNYKIPEFVLLFPHKQSWYAYGCIEYKCLILCFPEGYQHFLSNFSFFWTMN